MVKYDIGSGRIYKEGYKRVDCDKETHPDICCTAEEITQHIKKNTADKIRAYHIVEHVMPGVPLYNTLAGFWEVLKPNGTVEIAVPNTEYAMHAFARGEITIDIAEKIILGSDPGATPFMLHKVMFTRAKLKRYLEITGFINITDVSNKKDEIIMTADKPDTGNGTD